MGDHAICSKCRHSVLLGFIDKDGLCPVCRGPVEGSRTADPVEKKHIHSYRKNGSCKCGRVRRK